LLGYLNICSVVGLFSHSLHNNLYLRLSQEYLYCMLSWEFTP